MTMAPLKLLLSSYTLSGLAAASLAAQGAGALGALLVFWLGGAIMVFALGMTPPMRNAFRTEDPEASTMAADDEVASALARLDRDCAEDVAAGATRAVG